MNNKHTQDIVANLGDNPITHWNADALVALPTETVYGLSANAESSEAVAKIFALKNRPRFNPLIVHVGSVAMAQRYAHWNDLAEALAAAFWPGPLTLILPIKPDAGVSDLVTCGGDTVALRMPNHPLSLPLLAQYGKGVAAPSANKSGRISPTCAAHVRAEFGEDTPLLLDGGPCMVGLESTIIDISDGTHMRLLRPGSITQAMLHNALPNISDVSPEQQAGVLRAPGQLKSHYAPRTPLRLDADSVAADEALLAFGPNPMEGAAQTINLSKSGELTEAACNLFAALRMLDEAGHRAIAVMSIPQEGIGAAIHDRLSRAASA